MSTVTDRPKRGYRTIRLPLAEADYERFIGDDEEGWGCLGYNGGSVALHAAPNSTSAPVGRIDLGDWISVGGHQSVDGWTYVTTYGTSWGAFRSGGWMPMEITISCEAEAG